MVEIVANDSYKKPMFVHRLLFYVRLDLMAKRWGRPVRRCVGRIVRAGGW